MRGGLALVLGTGAAAGGGTTGDVTDDTAAIGAGVGGVAVGRVGLAVGASGIGVGATAAWAQPASWATVKIRPVTL